VLYILFGRGPEADLVAEEGRPDPIPSRGVEPAAVAR
jgi:hypothetical protein